MRLASRLKLKWVLVLVLGAAGGMGVMRIMSKLGDDARMVRVVPRSVDDPFPPGFFDVAPLATKDESGPAIIKPGQILAVEVLEALPGRPITGERVVLPDGTINLGFYGDVHVAGLNRNQIKVKIIEHLRKYINDEVLGIKDENEDGSIDLHPPVESNRIFVDESSNYIQPIAKGGRNDSEALSGRIDELNSKLDRILKELEQLRGERRSAEAPPAAPAKP